MRILVVLVECRGAEALVPETVKRAGGTSPVTVLQVLDPEYADRLCRKLRQDGWMGAHRSEEVGQTIGEEYRRRFDETVTNICEQLRAAGLDVRHTCRNGDLINTALRVTEEEGNIGLIIVGQPRRIWLTRWFKDLNLRVLCDRAACEVELVELPDE